MNDLIILLTLLTVLLVLLAIMTLLGHAMWLLVAALWRAFVGPGKQSSAPSPLSTWHCLNCNSEAAASLQFCDVCGSQQPSSSEVKLFEELAATERQIVRFCSDGKVNDQTYEQLIKQIREERLRLQSRGIANTNKEKASGYGWTFVEEDPTSSLEAPPRTIDATPPVVTASLIASNDEIIIEPAPSFIADGKPVLSESPSAFRQEQFTAPTPRRPRKPFTEVLNSFMEESNIRWGEIIGGLLIIGCSTALVISLWAQISQIPVLKFLIFTTVTAILFGIGLYTEHRWKLPTTSRGILTIATLLVPLNFLAIAAVSASNTSGALVIGSELIAPAIFLCLVYFAGCVITPKYAHLLSAGVLGSSIGQLLVRHFASTDSSPALLIFLGAFPVVCYVATVGLALRVVLADREIDETETTTVFTILGTMSFAALLPFGLLLYKAGPLGLTMMYLAPLVTLWGLPMLATGTVLWRRIKNKELVASRTTGTALGILGVMIVLAGMILAWPNPASIIPAALLNFAIFTALAVVLDLPIAHLIGAVCFGLAYLVAYHVLAGHIEWQNLRVKSLLATSLSFSSGQALLGTFGLFVGASEWLSRRKRVPDSFYYFVAACLVAAVSLALATVFGLGSAQFHSLWIVYGLYSLGAFWIAWRRGLLPFTWIASALLLFALVDTFAYPLSFSFPWQTAFLAHATLCGVAAIIAGRYKSGRVISNPLNDSALISLVLGVVSLFQANIWQVTSMQAQRLVWIAAILLVLLWRNRRRILFVAFQIALTCAVVLSVKATLQEYEWYSYLPHAFLHPVALQIQGTVLALLSLIWISLRLGVKRFLPGEQVENELDRTNVQESWREAAWRLLNTNYSVDQLISWGLLGAFLLLSVYGAFSGVTQELAASGSGYPGLDIAGFPHQDALGLGSWIVLGLLTITMLASMWEIRRTVFLLGAIASLSAAAPLFAGQFENQVATATSWRWLAAVFLLCGSIALWFREKILPRLSSLGWPELDRDNEELAVRIRQLLIFLTVVPLLALTIYPALRAIYYFPVQGPTSGIFSLLDDDFSYGIPLVLVALTMIGYAIRDRRPEFSFYGGLLFNATVTLAVLLSVVAVNGLMDRAVLVSLIQLNAITLAVYTLPWQSTRNRWQRVLNQAQTKLADYLLKLQIEIAIGLNVLLIVPIAIGLVFVPEPAGIGTLAAGNFIGWLTLVTTLVAAVWFAWSREERFKAIALAVVLVACSCLLSFSLSTKSGWVGLHALTIAVTIASWLMLAASSFTFREPNAAAVQSRFGMIAAVFDPSNWESDCRRLAAIIGGFGVFLSLRTVVDFKTSSWWSIAPLLLLSALAATLNWQTLRRRYLYAAGLLFNVAVSLWWIFFVREHFPAHSFWYVNLIAGSLAGILWLWLELRSRRLCADETGRTTTLSFHNVVATFAFALLLLIVLESYVAGGLSPLRETPVLAWFGLASVASLITACLWDKQARYAVAALYLLGLIAAAMALHQLELSSTRLGWSAAVFMAIYAIITALLWRWRGKLIALAQQFRVPARIGPEVTQLDWLSAFSILAVAVVTSIAYWINLRFLDFGLRSTAAIAVAAQAVTFGLLGEGNLRERWRHAAIGILIVGTILFSWSWLTPGVDSTWLNRSVILMVEAFGLTALYGLLLNKLRDLLPAWANAARACVPWLIGAGVVALFFSLTTEVFYQVNFGAVRIHPVSLLAIGLTLASAIIICILFALSPAHDPLTLSERGRMTYVYAAEVMLTLLFVHIRLTLPWLFTGFIERYWPLAVMTIAYLGVVTSESLRRKELLVLAQPLERTGVFLPLLPVLGFWLAASEVDYSALLFIVGGLYGLLSILRRSFVFGMLAAVAGNAGLWYLLHRTADYQFLQHPQLWLIPVALSVLLAAYFNEDNLTEDQMAGIRYLSLVTIYASSTADIFINGVANSPWLPLILGSFSLAGVFSGIVFRIRGLLLLGSVFLLLSIITMIWYASANLGWTWLWYVAGIATGATIIFMFALFEKKRAEVLRVVEGFKEWER
jgi:hypothetical protein